MTEPALRLVGYSDEISVAPGETITFMVSADGVATYRADIVRLIHGDANPAGPGFKTGPAMPVGEFPGRKQETFAGSYVVVPEHQAMSGATSFTFAALVWPTTPVKAGLARGPQAIASRAWLGAGAAVMLALDDDGRAVLRFVNGGEAVDVVRGKPLLARHWYLVAASYDATTATAQLLQHPLTRYPGIDDAATVGARAAQPPPLAAPLTIAATLVEEAGERLRTALHFNGKIEAPALFARAVPVDELMAYYFGGGERAAPADLVAAWNFAREMSSVTIVDEGPHGLHGTCVNLPARAMKGARWTGEEMNWARRPEHYAAIHFYDDDLYDAGWQADFAWTVPADTPSGVYCARLASPDGAREDLVPFCVRPPRGRATADVAVLLPTASYMAYANDHNSVDVAAAEMMMGRLIVLQPADLYFDEHREYGLALYDTHSDGSGVCYSSRLRPILNMRPKYAAWVGGAGSGLWQFNADTHLIDWLEAKDITYDVVTDEDLHAEGASLLAPYRTVLTGTHPEYHSTAMWDATRAYLDGGGRLMYLGANGWYWRIAWHGQLPGVIEVRRAEDGIRTWAAEPGEYYHSFTGEYGGLWRRQGRPPNVLLGTGFTAQGFDVSGWYERQPDSFDARAAFIFEGIGADEKIGDFGLVGGGGAGLELDRVDPLLGTPPHTLKLASSVGHTDLYLLVAEEILVTTPNLSGTQNENVRADMAFFEGPEGGAVFSISSIAWCGSLSHDGYANNVSRITENVLRRFLDPAPFTRE